MSIPRILIVDDEEGIRDLVSMYLEKEGFEVNSASDGQAALRKIEKNKYDLFIVDVMMPKLDGFGLVREIRRFTDKPVIMLTAKGEEYERVLGFELGCDDYVVKPFSPRELVHRVKVLLKRTLDIETNEQNILKYPRLAIDKLARMAKVDDEEVALTPKELELLYYLAKNPGRVYTREQILERVWGYDYFGDLRTVDTHIKKLREKLGRSNGLDYISTVWGVGYKFEVKND